MYGAPLNVILAVTPLKNFLAEILQLVLLRLLILYNTVHTSNKDLFRLDLMGQCFHLHILTLE